jgi:hypothetical protein
MSVPGSRLGDSRQRLGAALAALGLWTVGVTATGAPNGLASGPAAPAAECRLSCQAHVPIAVVAERPVSLRADVTAEGCGAEPLVAWSFADGFSSADASPVHAFASAGEVAWTLTGSTDGATCSRSGTLVVDSAPTVPALFVPGVAHAPGVGGATWRTDLVVVNLSGGAVDLSASFTSTDGQIPAAASARIPDGASVEWEDVLVSLFGLAEDADAKGTIRIDASALLHVHSRTFNLSAAGTYGQYIPARAVGDAIGPGDEALVPQLRSAPGFRSNLGLLNPTGTECAVEVALRGADGAPLGPAQTWVVPAQGYWQRNDVFAAFGAGGHPLASLAARPRTAGCAVWVFGSVVDNQSGDPTTAPGLVDHAAGHSSVAAVAHAPGEAGTTWRTDLAVVNPGHLLVAAELSFHPQDGGAVISRRRMLGGGRTELWEDVLVSLFGLPPMATSSGAVRVAAAHPLAVSARTYNETAQGSYGQLMPAVAGSGALRPPSVGVVAGLKKTDRYRSNLGLLNPGAAEVTVLIRMFDALGRPIGRELTRVVPMAGWLQENDVFARAGAAAEPLAYATVQVLAPGSGVWAYGSLVDNDTGDPTTVPLLDTSSVGTPADLGGRYHVVIGPAPGFSAHVDHHGATLGLVLSGKGIELSGEGQLEGRSVSITSWISAEVQIVLELEFARDGQGFTGTWRGVGGPPMDGTITGARTPLPSWDLTAGPLPVVVEHLGFDLDPVERISRFRSGAGHDFSDDFEDCRSMKHYVQVWPELSPSVLVVYAPFAGTVIGATNEYDEEGQWKGVAIGLRSAAHPAFSMTYFHIHLDRPLQIGDEVAAGERLGVSAKASGTSTDLAMRVVTPDGYALVSYFQAMADDAFAPLEGRGVASRDALVIARAERDADPLTCDGEEFVDEGNLENYVWLTRP